jgi:hypothetical protein
VTFVFWSCNSFWISIKNFILFLFVLFGSYLLLFSPDLGDFCSKGNQTCSEIVSIARGVCVQWEVVFISSPIFCSGEE